MPALNAGPSEPTKAFGSEDFIAFDFDDDFTNATNSRAPSGYNSHHEDDDRAAPTNQHLRKPHLKDAANPSASASASASASSSRASSVSASGSGKGKKRKLDDREQEVQLSRKQRQAAAARATPWADDVDWDRCKNGAEMLHRELMAFDNWLAPSYAEHEVRSMVIELIARAIKSQWRDAQVFAFGSQQTKLYLPQGDIDLVVVSDSMEHARRESTLRSMASCLRKNNLATDVQVIARAKVPIVKFVCTYAKLKVDISINQTNGLAAAKYVNSWLYRSPCIRPLVMTVKHLLVQRGMSEVFSGGLGSYSVIIMVISFLQLHPKLQRDEIDPARNLGVLFLEFLELYGKYFGYDNVGISIRGKGGYFSKARRGWKDERRPFMLSIEDPHDPTNDISKGSYNIISIRSALAGAFDIITAAIYQQAKNRAEATGRHTKFGDHELIDPNEAARRALLEEARNGGPSVHGTDDKHPRSLLGTVLGVSPAMVKQRRDMDDLFHSGSLQHRLGIPPPSRDEDFAPPLEPHTVMGDVLAPVEPGKGKKDMSNRAKRFVEKAQRKKEKKERQKAKKKALKEAGAGDGDGDGDGADADNAISVADSSRANSPDNEKEKSGFDMARENGTSKAHANGKSLADAIRISSDSEDDSRYTRPASKKRKKASGSSTAVVAGVDDDLSLSAPSTFVSDSSEDNRSDEDLSLPTAVNSNGTSAISSPRAGGAKGSPKPTQPKTKGSKKLSKRERRDFWASKSGTNSPVPRDGSGVAAILE